ncbi:unnamed protein product [Schistosoma guineensis]|uniref:Dynein light chain n=1 Tax=Schistosoma mattheei TaxID=31246 RepID=A0A183NDI2_9TREM|nr:unnamed protein product [Schistosoma mattheei]CAH8482535.1 unnamed protein product [Schistosoma intercalatum]CAH8483560.1 unnamed protein product [Schistosoma guineensis]CAH8488443.1 unnamed protein product [Schistosoma curassoni]CAH8482914.1 unnamed protein product [Schistosoma intercalatum]
MSSLKAIIKSVDMPDVMQQDAVDICAMAIKKYSMEKDIAAFMKKEFDRKYSPSWHCIVGSHFGTYISHEAKHFIYFFLDNHAVVLFRTGTIN